MRRHRRPSAALLLDVGGVLLLPDHERVRAATERAGFLPDPAGIDRAHYAAVLAFDRAPRESFYEAYVPAFAAAIDVPPDRLAGVAIELLALFARFGAWTRVVEDSVVALQELSAAGVPIAIVSNTQGTMAAQLSALGVCQVGRGEAARVEEIVDSAVVGVEKPDPRIFEIALNALHVPAQRAVHVGDSVHFDVRGAAAAGVVGVHFDPFRLCAERSHAHVRSLREISSFLTADA